MCLSNKSYIKKIFFSLLALVILFFTSKLMLQGGGVNDSERQIFLLVILIIFLSSSKKSFWFLVFPMCVIYAIYSPIGLMFGKPTYQYVASVFATDFLESKEFFYQIPKVNYLYPFVIIFGVVLYRYIIVRFDIKLYRNKTVVIIAVIFSMLNQSPSEFFKTIIKSSIEVKNELVKLNEIKPKSDWGESFIDKSIYNTYILVIGESARKDYHGAYGYPINNTPFMSRANGYLIDGLMSGGTNTVASLRLMLTKPNVDRWEPNYSLNIIDLIKSAGIETYWISNQGYFGDFDTPISAIASKSDHKFFLKSGDYASKNTSDFILLDKIKDIVINNHNKKFIVVHLYGSHPNACDRINDYKKIINIKDKKYDYLSCYVSSIQKTDLFLEKLNNFMRENDNSYSMIYFSDHGQAHREIGGEIYFNNNRASKLHFDVPLFMISSDDDSRHECKSFKSGFNFVNGIASWVGIKNKKIDSNYSLFDCNDDPNDFGVKKYIESIELELDPAIDLRGK